MARPLRSVPPLAAVLACTGLHAGLPPVAVDVLLSQGDPLAGSTVATLNPVFPDGEGRPGSLVALANGNRAIWYDGAVVFDSGEVAGSVLTGGEATIGIGNDGAFVYSPNTDGEDSVWTQAGLLLRGTDPAPGLPGQFTTFHSRPSMLPDGRAVWVGGITNTQGGSTQGRVLYRATTTAPFAYEPLLSTGDMVGGFAIGTTGVGFQYQMSDSGEHLVMLLVLQTGSAANDTGVYRNGALVAQEGSPVGPSAPGENWQNFAGVAVNDSGDWLLAGDTDGAVASDAFLAFNGELLVREGDLLDGELLPAGSALRAIALNNKGQALHAWNTPGNVRKLFFANDAGRLHDSLLLLRTGSGLDLTGDGSTDATLVDILGTFTTTTGLSLAEDGAIYIQASYDQGGSTRTSLLRLALPDRLFRNGFQDPAPR
ncbi:MAG: hypothetical protein KF823_08265 [Xanthomonadales bacterium]|nr:hypothetical protein [Xanthomonadales bacterium]